MLVTHPGRPSPTSQASESSEPEPLNGSSLPSLDEAATTDTATCGHKAATLARLRQAGFDVPPGFVIPAHAQLDELAIARALEKLPGPVAVRSSGLAEDLPDASFAGQYDTVLNVRGVADVLVAARQCIASANSERLRSYGGSDAVAVLVQSMVGASAAGVAFSANPVTGDRDEVLISATRGLGDRLVAGEVTGDEWTVRDGVASARAEPQAALDSTAAARVAALAQKLEEQLGAPQDIEWALQGERLWLLQSRPITVLPVAPRIELPEGTWQKDTAHYPDPVTPFGACVFPGYAVASSQMIENWGLMPDTVLVRAIGHDVYSHADPDGGGKAPPPWWLLGIVARLVPSIRRKLRRAQQAIDAGRLASTPPRWEAEWKPQLEREVATFATVDLQQFDDVRLFAHFAELVAFAERALVIHFELFVPYLVGVHELAQVCHELLGWELHQTMALLQGLSVASSAPTRQLHAIAELARSRPRARAVIERGGRDFALELREADVQVGQELDAYLARWGLRTINYDAGTPGLAEQPELVASLLADLLEPAQDTASPNERRAAAVEAARARIEGEANHARFDAVLSYAELVYPQREDNVQYTDNLPNGLLRRLALEVGRRLVERGLLRKREDAVFLTAEELRLALLGKLEDLHEPPSAIVSRVRAERAWVRANPGPLVYGPTPGAMANVRGLPEAARRLNGALLWAMEQELSPARSSDGEELRGIPSSPGVAIGPVRLIRSSDEIQRVRQSDIVVCPTTTPAWTVIFHRAAALVTDGGSALSHAAIVAREHGIPAVVATGNATQRLREGQRVRVDGNSGSVVIVEE